MKKITKDLGVPLSELTTSFKDSKKSKKKKSKPKTQKKENEDTNIVMISELGLK